jgi:hypothetical protein
MDEKQHQHDVIIVVANGCIEVAQQFFLHSWNFDISYIYGSTNGEFCSLQLMCNLSHNIHVAKIC